MADGNLAFHSNDNKDFLRKQFDGPLIEDWARCQGRRLHYLGLPGPEMLDIVEWQQSLDRFSTIERRENEQHLLFLRANVHDVEHRLHSLYGEFDDILTTSRDEYGHAPRWPYDLINLDFFGGLLYRDLARPRAIAKTIENQDNYERSFLLIISYHLRDGDFSNEKVAFLDDLELRLRRDADRKLDVAGLMAWYRRADTPDAARQALYLNSFLYDVGETHRFRVTTRSPIIYSGTGGARMIHFVTTFEHRGGAHRAVSEQSLVDVVNLGYTELDQGVFKEPVTIPRLTLK